MPKNTKVREATVYPISHNLSSDRKEYTISGGMNSHGKFVRIEEMVRGKKNFLFVPPERVEELCGLITQTAKEINEYTPPKAKKDAK